MPKPKYKIFREKLINIIPEDYKKLSSLTLRERGRMRLDCSRARKNKKENVYVFSAKDGEKILGWCSVFVNDSYCRMFIYIRCKNRRNGIGNALFGRVNAFVKSIGKTLEVFPWNAEARGFYQDKICHKNYE